MSIVVSTDARVKDVTVTDDLITFNLVDGRVISVPLAWSWRLSEATPAQRDNSEIIKAAGFRKLTAVGRFTAVVAALA